MRIPGTLSSARANSYCKCIQQQQVQLLGSRKEQMSTFMIALLSAINRCLVRQVERRSISVDIKEITPEYS